MACAASRPQCAAPAAATRQAVSDSVTDLALELRLSANIVRAGASLGVELLRETVVMQSS